MSDVTVSRAVRPGLLSLRSIVGPLAKVQAPGSAGVSSLAADPVRPSAATDLASRTRDLALLFDSVSNAVRTLAAADRGITAITGVVEAAQATAHEALRHPAHGVDSRRAELVEAYDGLLAQVDELAAAAGFDGVNLLNGDNLSVPLSASGSSRLDIDGVTDTASGLGLATLEMTAFDTNSSINATLDKLEGAIETLRGQSTRFGSNLAVVVSRQDFTGNMISVLQTGAASLSLAHTSEEAANVLALHIRQQLSSTSSSLASRADQNVLRLL